MEDSSLIASGGNQFRGESKLEANRHGHLRTTWLGKPLFMRVTGPMAGRLFIYAASSGPPLAKRNIQR